MATCSSNATVTAVAINAHGDIVAIVRDGFKEQIHFQPNFDGWDGERLWVALQQPFNDPISCLAAGEESYFVGQATGALFIFDRKQFKKPRRFTPAFKCMQFTAPLTSIDEIDPSVLLIAVPHEITTARTPINDGHKFSLSAPFASQSITISCARRVDLSDGAVIVAVGLDGEGRLYVRSAKWNGDSMSGLRWETVVREERVPEPVDDLNGLVTAVSGVTGVRLLSRQGRLVVSTRESLVMLDLAEPGLGPRISSPDAASPWSMGASRSKIAIARMFADDSGKLMTRALDGAHEDVPKDLGISKEDILSMTERGMEAT